MTDTASPPLRGTGFWLLWCNAVSISMVGSADRFTFEWLVGDTLDASDGVTGLVLFALGAPVCAFVLVAGAMADRHDRRRMLLITQLGGSLVLACAAVLVWSGAAGVGSVIVVALAFGTVMAFSQPVRSALLPAMVPQQSLMRGIVVMTIGSNVAMIGGPLLAGTVIDRWGVGWAFAVQASFLMVGVLLVRALQVPPLEPRTERRRLRRDVADVQHPGWLPHVTLGRRIPRSDVPAALAVLGHADVVLRLDTLRRWDPDAGVVRTLAGPGPARPD